MNFNKNNLRNARQWRASIGMDESRFNKLVKMFEHEYVIEFGMSMEKFKSLSPQEFISIITCEELLFFTLFSLKSGLTNDVVGAIMGMDGSTAKRNRDLGIKLLKKTFKNNGLSPVRSISTVKEFKEVFSDTDTIIIDGTEQRIERPNDKHGVKDNYSGKKNAIR